MLSLSGFAISPIVIFLAVAQSPSTFDEDKYCQSILDEFKGEIEQKTGKNYSELTVDWCEGIVTSVVTIYIAVSMKKFNCTF